MLTHSSKNNYVQFQLKNEILFKTRIVRGQGVKVNGPYLNDHIVGTADVIDLNRNGDADMTRESSEFLRKRLMYTEPVLDESVDSMKRYAESRGEEILTRENLGNRVQVKEYGVDIGKTAFQSMEGVERNYRTLDALVDDVAGYDPDAQWAISPSTREFFVFKPGAGSATPEAVGEPRPVAPEPLPFDKYETEDYSVQMTYGKTPMHVFMQDDRSVSVHGPDGGIITLEEAFPESMRDGVMETLRRAMADPDFSIGMVRSMKSKKDGSQTFMVADHSRYFECSSKTGFKSGEFGL